MDRQEVIGYKVFNPDWTCRNKQYTCPGVFEEDINLSVCRVGMHFCKKLIDCFNYYKFNPQNKVAEVMAYGEVKEKDNKCCTNKLKIVREISWAELLELVNIGNGCTGLGNRGDYNSGNCNSGDCNSGNYNSGDYNSGDYNSGSHNSGNYNSGNRNSGHGNSGNYNKTNYSNGWFNTKESKIPMFNKISEWTGEDAENSEAKKILDFLEGSLCEWVYDCDMTDEEKEAHPDYKTTGGYLKEVGLWNDAPNKWGKLTQKEKDTVMSIPNFDKEIFKEITGIDVDN